MYICIFGHAFHCTMTDSVQNENKDYLHYLSVFYMRNEYFRIFILFFLKLLVCKPSLFKTFSQYETKIILFLPKKFDSTF